MSHARFLLLVSTAFALAACGGDPPATDSGPGTDGAMPSDGGGGDGGGPIDGGGGPIDGGGGPIDGGGGPIDSGGPFDAGPDPAPAFRTPHPEIADADLAMQALRIMGAPAAGATSMSCNECHTITRARIRYWRALSDTAMANCLTDLSVSSDASATAMLDCLRDPDSGNFTTPRLGVWATASNLAWFQYVFRHGVPGDWMTAHTAFVTGAGMPPPTRTSMTQADFDIVAEWFLRGVPNVDTILPADGRSMTCLPGVSADMRAHVADMATMGWAALNRADGMLMYGCAGAATPAACLSTEPLASTTAYGAGWETIPTGGVPGAHLRVLYTTTYASAWWTRSSPDGRFVSHGAASAPNLRFIDLNTDTVIGGNADYDPAFFPDGTGFVIQNAGSGARICEQRVLTTGSTMLTFMEAGCSSGAGIGLYEHVGTSLSGLDYWSIDGSPASSSVYDNGGQSATLSNPLASFGAGSGADLTLMVNDGTRFTISGTEHVATPYEGDATISPSLRLISLRAAGPAGQLAYVIHRVDTTGSGASLSVSIPEIARFCAVGGKPAFSYDERWLVFHHYVLDSDAVELGFTGPTDPGFAGYRTRGAANVYMIDLTTGEQYRITNMAAGQYALFPHFRSDGWMYMTVRTESATPEHIVASDAALLLAP